LVENDPEGDLEAQRKLAVPLLAKYGFPFNQRQRARFHTSSADSAGFAVELAAV